MKYRTLILLACLTAPVSIGLGQQTTATVSGNVTDSSGARIAKAKITATNLDTNIQRYSTTNNEGAYSLLFVPIGRYAVEINAQGFKRFEQNRPGAWRSTKTRTWMRCWCRSAPSARPSKSEPTRRWWKPANRPWG